MSPVFIPEWTETDDDDEPVCADCGRTSPDFDDEEGREHAMRVGPVAWPGCPHILCDYCTNHHNCEGMKDAEAKSQ